MKKILFIFLILFILGCQQTQLEKETKTVEKVAIEEKIEKEAGALRVVVEEKGEFPINQVELSKHSTDKDCWIAYAGNVYDITEYLPKHKSSLVNFCGTSSDFENAFIKKFSLEYDIHI